MRDLRNVNRIAAAVNASAIVTALMRCPIATVLLIVVSNLLLVWSLERLRTAVAREPVA